MPLKIYLRKYQGSFHLLWRSPKQERRMEFITAMTSWWNIWCRMSFRLKIAERILPSSGADIRSDVIAKHLLCLVLEEKFWKLRIRCRTSVIEAKELESSMLTFDEEHRHATKRILICQPEDEIIESQCFAGHYLCWALRRGLYAMI